MWEEVRERELREGRKQRGHGGLGRLWEQKCDFVLTVAATVGGMQGSDMQWLWL